MKSALMNPAPKYARMEIERRWLVDLSSVAPLTVQLSRIIEDLYIDGTQLRLRKVTGPDSPIEYKLGKKYGKTSRLSEATTNLYLQEHEYVTLSRLPGRTSRKRRYAVAEGSLDVYETPNPGAAVFEVEFNSEASALAYTPPSFVTREVTGDPQFTGAALTQEREV